MGVKDKKKEEEEEEDDEYDYDDPKLSSSSTAANIEMTALNPTTTTAAAAKSTTTTTTTTTDKKNGDDGDDAIHHSISILVAQCQQSCHQCTMIVRMVKDVYPTYFYSIASIVVVLFLYFGLVVPISVRTQVLRINHMTRDYSDLELDYNFKAAQIDHYCLYGSDDKCACEDPTESVSREYQMGWVKQHDYNLNKIRTWLHNDPKSESIDVVFIGDDLVATFGDNTNINTLQQKGKGLQGYVNKTFGTGQYGGLRQGKNVNGLALGIPGDGATNVMWRLQHGEMPKELKPKVWWIMIGANDLSLMGCSEEVVTLGILRVAEEISFHHPLSTIVIQALLPRSFRADGSLQGKRNNKGHLKRGAAASAGGNHHHHFLRRLQQQQQQQQKQERNMFGQVVRVVQEEHEQQDEKEMNPQEEQEQTDASAKDSGEGDKIYKNMEATQIKHIGGVGQHVATTAAGGENKLSPTQEALQQLKDRQKNKYQGGVGYTHNQVEDKYNKYKLYKNKDPKQEFYRAHEKALANANMGRYSGGVGVDSTGNLATTSSKTPPKQLYIKDDPLRYYGPTSRYVRDLWPSIQAINSELELFCKKHDNFIYFDASELYVGTVGNRHYQQSTPQIIPELMPDFMSLSQKGYTVLGDHIVKELKRIILNDDKSNDIEQKGDNSND